MYELVLQVLYWSRFNKAKSGCCFDMTVSNFEDQAIILDLSRSDPESVTHALGTMTVK